MIRKSSIQIHLNWFKLRRQAATLFQLNCVFACAVWGPWRTKLTSATAQFLLYEAAGLSTSLAFPSHTHTHTQSANRRFEKCHLCLPGLPGDEEEAVIGGVDPVGASLADHDATSGVSTAAAAAVMLQKGNYMFHLIRKRADAVVQYIFFKAHKTPTMRGPPVVPALSAKKERNMQSVHEGTVTSE